ncbi:MAG TPA: hypothetical protein VNF06_01580, partial [Candidatus Aquilonibacter sp.]|nr:hypothetical protein [Candidatus Aquilonibacter sp.]
RKPVSCESEAIIFIANVFEKNKLDVQALFEKGISKIDNRDMIEKMARIMYTRYDYTQLDISKYLDIPPDAAYRIINKQIEESKSKKKHIKIVEERELEQLKKITAVKAIKKA